MPFIKFFRSHMPEILTRLKVTRLELAKIQSDAERLLIMEQNYANSDLTESQYAYIVKAAIDCFDVALWIKDENHKILFANKACCDKIFKCSEYEAINSVSEGNALSAVCHISDEKVRDRLTTMRFIEHAVYENGGELFIDAVKSPRVEHGEFIGTIGSGVDITESIPKAIKDQNRTSTSIEIPLDASMGTRKLVELLERRKDGARNKDGDAEFRELRRKKRTVGGKENDPDKK